MTSPERRSVARLTTAVLGLTAAVLTTVFLQEVTRRAAVPESQGESAARTYTVRPGDTLWGIARDLLGSGGRYRELERLNPNLATGALAVGMEIRIPGDKPPRTLQGGRRGVQCR